MALDSPEMLRARHIVESHIQSYGYIPHPDKMKEAIAALLEGPMHTAKTGIGTHTSVTKELFEALGDSNHKVSRWMHGAKPFSYWSREEIEVALNEVDSKAGADSEKVVAEFEGIFGKLTATERRWLTRRIAGQEV